MIWSVAGLQRSRRFDEARVIVGVAKLGLGEKAEFGFIEDQDIDEIEHFSAECDRRRRIENRGRAGRTGALEKGADRGQRNFELADRDIAFRKRRRGDIGGADQRIGAGHDDDGVVGIGEGDDRRAGMGVGGFLHKREVDALRGEERLQLIAERILADPADQRGRRAELGGCDRLVGALAAGKIQHRFAGDGLADPGMPVGRRHHIHVDAAGDEDAAHV